MAAILHLGFFEIQFLTIWAVKRPILHIPNFAKIFQTVAEMKSFFCDFQHTGRRHLRYSKIRNFYSRCAQKGPMCFTVPKFIKISRTVAEIWRFNGFQNGGHAPSSICWPPVWTTHDDHLVVSIVVQNLVVIGAVVSITWNFQYFARLAWKRLFTPDNWGFRGISPPPPNGEQYQRNPPKRHTRVRVRVVWAIKRENPSTGLTCRWVPEKRYK